jgi:hypothetical protein
MLPPGFDLLAMSIFTKMGRSPKDIMKALHIQGWIDLNDKTLRKSFESFKVKYPEDANISFLRFAVGMYKANEKHLKKLKKAKKAEKKAKKQAKATGAPESTPTPEPTPEPAKPAKKKAEKKPKEPPTA